MGGCNIFDGRSKVGKDMHVSSGFKQYRNDRSHDASCHKNC